MVGSCAGSWGGCRGSSRDAKATAAARGSRETCARELGAQHAVGGVAGKPTASSPRRLECGHVPRTGHLPTGCLALIGLLTLHQESSLLLWQLAGQDTAGEPSTAARYPLPKARWPRLSPAIASVTVGRLCGCAGLVCWDGRVSTWQNAWLCKRSNALAGKGVCCARGALPGASSPAWAAGRSACPGRGAVSCVRAAALSTPAAPTPGPSPPWPP